MVKIGYYGNEGLGLAWDFKGIFCVFFMRTKFMIRDAKKICFFFNLDLEVAMEKYVGCFLVYPF